MKKLAIFGGIIVVLFAAIIVLTNISNQDKLKDNPYGTEELQQSTIDLLSDKNYQNIILPEPLEEKIASGEPVFTYFFSPECGYCKLMTPKLMPIAEEFDIQIDQLNLLEFQDQGQKYNLEGTPTLIFFNDGEEVTRLYGDHDEETIRQFFESLNLK